MILSDWNFLGPKTFFLAGFPCAALAGLSQSLRNDVLEEEYDARVFRPAGMFDAVTLARTIRIQRLDSFKLVPSAC
jgi:hypothetical protein